MSARRTARSVPTGSPTGPARCENAAGASGASAGPDHATALSGASISQPTRQAVAFHYSVVIGTVPYNRVLLAAHHDLRSRPAQVVGGGHDRAVGADRTRG